MLLCTCYFIKLIDTDSACLIVWVYRYIYVCFSHFNVLQQHSVSWLTNRHAMLCYVIIIKNKHARPRNIQMEMYASHVTCCLLASHVEYAPCTLLKLEKRWDRQTDKRTDRHMDGRQTDALCLPLEAVTIIKIL